MGESKYVIGAVDPSCIRDGLLYLEEGQDIRYISHFEVSLPMVNRSQFNRTMDGESRRVVVIRGFEEISDVEPNPQPADLHRIHKTYTRDISKALVLDGFRAQYVASLLSLVLKDKSPSFIVHELNKDPRESRQLTYF